MATVTRTTRRLSVSPERMLVYGCAVLSSLLYLLSRFRLPLLIRLPVFAAFFVWLIWVIVWVLVRRAFGIELTTDIVWELFTNRAAITAVGLGETEFVLSTAILLTASRGAFAAALVALLVIPWTSGHMSARTKAAVYAVTVGSLLLAASLVPRASLDRLGSTRSDMAAGYFGGRGVIWKSGLEIVRENPLVGVGAGAFGAAVEPGLGRYLSSHQGFLSILVEEGTVGLALFLCMALAVIGQLSRLPTLQRRFSIVILAASDRSIRTRGRWRARPGRRT